MAFWNVPNTFATQTGNVPASQLDNNFGALAVSPLPCTAGGTANAITLTPTGTSVTFTSLSAGMSFIFEATNTNTSYTVTIAVAGLAAAPVYVDQTTQPAPGQINAGSAYVVYYDGTDFMLIGATATGNTTTNYIINGGFKIDQRNSGALVSAVANNAYTVDRWQYAFSAGGAPALVASMQQVTPTIATASYLTKSLIYTVTTAHTTIAAGDYALIQQKLEGYNTSDLLARTFNVTFWVKASVAGTYCLSFRNGAGNASYVAEYTINSANTWEKKVVVVTGGLSTSYTWASDNTAGLTVSWTLTAGTTFQGTANTWSSSTYYATSNQVNTLVQTLNNTFSLAGVQLYLGGSSPTYQELTYDEDLQQCLRYYTSFISGGNQTSGYPNIYANYGNAAGNVQQTQVHYSVTLRTAPTLTKIGTWAASNCGQPTLSTAGPTSITFSATSLAAGSFQTVASGAGTGYTADAEL